MNQDGSQKQSKRAKIAIKDDSENMHLDKLFKLLLEHQASQESPKTAKKPPKMAPDSLQQLLEKGVQFWINVLAKRHPQNEPKSSLKSVQKLLRKMTPVITPKLPILGPKIDPKWPKTAGLGARSNLDGGF